MTSTLGPTRTLDKGRFFSNVGYRPHEKQQLFHTSAARYRVCVCGRRFGKSQMSAMDLMPELFAPNRNYWIVGPTYDLGEREFRVIWKTLERQGILNGETGIKGTYNRANGKMWIQFPWDTRLEVRSADHPDSLVGDGLHGVIMSEAAKMPSNIWSQYIQPALTDFRGWATFPTHAGRYAELDLRPVETGPAPGRAGLRELGRSPAG
jgi:phage terminase large subunit